MSFYNPENKQDKKEIARIKKWAKKNPEAKTGTYLCLVDKDKANEWGVDKGYPAHTEDSWGLFEKNVNGYKWAKEVYPYKEKK